VVFVLELKDILAAADLIKYVQQGVVAPKLKTLTLRVGTALSLARRQHLSMASEPEALKLDGLVGGFKCLVDLTLRFVERIYLEDDVIAAFLSTRNHDLSVLNFEDTKVSVSFKGFNMLAAADVAVIGG
jgi:hypothetical protein